MSLGSTVSGSGDPPSDWFVHLGSEPAGSPVALDWSTGWEKGRGHEAQVIDLLAAMGQGLAMARRVPLLRRLAKLDPPVDDPELALAEQRVSVDGVIVTNPSSQVLPTARIVVKTATTLQGVRKLTPALERFGIETEGAVALDLGACTGGFTQALLDRGAAAVYAVDVGFGQLLGSLRQDPRVVCLERTNVAAVTPELLGARPSVIVCDVTKLALRDVGQQLAANNVPTAGTDFIGLVKPMFELATAELPRLREELEHAVERARVGLTKAGWDVQNSMESVITGHRGAVEFFIHSRWPSA